MTEISVQSHGLNRRDMLPIPDDDLVLYTFRLHLIAARMVHLRTELDDPSQLALLLNAEVPSSWPPGEYDRSAISFFLSRYEESSPQSVGWYAWYAILPANAQEAARLVGAAGYFGPPAADGVVEIGYSVVPESRRQGYGTEVARALTERALRLSSVTRVIAHVSDDNISSRIVLERAGFRPVGRVEPGRYRYERAKGL